MLLIRCLITLLVQSSIISIDITILHITSSGRLLMCSRKSEEPIMEPWEIPAVTGYSSRDFPSRITMLSITEKKWNKGKYPTWNSILFEFETKTSMSNPAECLDISSLSSPRPIKNPSNSIRCKWQKIYSGSRRPETILKIRKKATFLRLIDIFYKFFKDFTNQRKKTNIMVDFCHRWELTSILQTVFFLMYNEKFS